MEKLPNSIIIPLPIGSSTYDSIPGEYFVEDQDAAILSEIDETYFVNDHIISDSQLDLLTRSDEIDEIGLCCEKIIEQLKADIDSGDIGLIIGDDISGRLPTLIIRGVISKLYQQSGEQSPKTIFITGDNTIKSPEMVSKICQIQDLIKSSRIPESKKALIVTDTLSSGNTVDPIVTALDRLSVDYTIATSGLVGSEHVLKSLYKKIIYATISTPEIYFDPDKNHLAGVSKQIGSGKIHSDYDSTKRELAVQSRGMAKKQVDKIIRSL